MVTQHAVIRARQRWHVRGSHLYVRDAIIETLETARFTRDAKGGREWYSSGKGAVLLDVTLEGIGVVITVGIERGLRQIRQMERKARRKWGNA